MDIKSILPPGIHFATIGMESRFLHPVKKGVLLAKATLVEHKGTILKGSCDIHDETGRTVMTFASVFKTANDATIKDIRFENK